jgi:diaminopimelate epimerase
MLNFTKMNGAGNDFIMLDNRSLELSLDEGLINRLCDRHRGIGADGLIIAEPSEEEGTLRMRYYNSDGREAEMCGNGARCFARYVDRTAALDGNPLNFQTMAGPAAARFQGNLVQLQLSDPFDLVMDKKIEIQGQMHTVHSINTGVPHAVIILENIADSGVRDLGAAVRYHKHFQPSGTNVNFLTVRSPNEISIRTYERGVEDETLACGTGMVACAIIHDQLTECGNPINVHVKGGDTLKVEWQLEGMNHHRVTLTGPAEFVFDGKINV